MEGKGNGKIETVVGSLVDDDEGVLCWRKLAEVDAVFGSGE